MAGKHQIWSSNKKTRQRANRCWRRQNKLRLQNEPLSEQAGRNAAIEAEKFKSGPLVHATEGDNGTQLGPLINQALHEGKQVKVQEFAAMVNKWNRCTMPEFQVIMKHIPNRDVGAEFHRFQAMPLEYFLALPIDPQARFISWLKRCD